MYLLPYGCNHFTFVGITSIPPVENEYRENPRTLIENLGNFPPNHGLIRKPHGDNRLFPVGRWTVYKIAYCDLKYLYVNLFESRMPRFTVASCTHAIQTKLCVALGLNLLCIKWLVLVNFSYWNQLPCILSKTINCWIVEVDIVDWEVLFFIAVVCTIFAIWVILHRCIIWHSSNSLNIDSEKERAITIGDFSVLCDISSVVVWNFYKYIVNLLQRNWRK